MCCWCDSWSPYQYEYNGLTFCTSSCLEEYKKSQNKHKQKRIEEIDATINQLQNEKNRLMSDLGFTQKKYPWQ